MFCNGRCHRIVDPASALATRTCVGVTTVLAYAASAFGAFCQVSWHEVLASLLALREVPSAAGLDTGAVALAVFELFDYFVGLSFADKVLTTTAQER